MIAGLIAAQEDGAEHFVTRQIIFTRPRKQDGSVDVSVADQTGHIAFLGVLQPVASGLVLTLSDHARERFPTRVEGLVTDHDIALTATVYGRRARPKDSGEVEVIRR